MTAAGRPHLDLPAVDAATSPEVSDGEKKNHPNPQEQKHPLAFSRFLFPAPAAVTGFEAGFCPGCSGRGGGGPGRGRGGGWCLAARPRPSPVHTAAGRQAGKERDGGRALPRPGEGGAGGPAGSHLRLDVADALGVLPRGAVEAPDGPGAQLVVDVEEDGERQEEEADEDPAVVHQHGLQPPVPHPQQQQQQPRAQRPHRRHGDRRPHALPHGRRDPSIPRPPLARSPPSPAPPPAPPASHWPSPASAVRRGEGRGQ